MSDEPPELRLEELARRTKTSPSLMGKILRDWQRDGVAEEVEGLWRLTPKGEQLGSTVLGALTELGGDDGELNAYAARRAPSPHPPAKRDEAA